MKNYMELDAVSIDILKEIGNIGIGNAASSLAHIMNYPVEIEIPGLKVITYQEIHTILDKADDLQTGILVEIYGELKGMFLFLLTEEFTASLLENMFEERQGDLLDLDEMEQSFICELGNIMCGTYIRALAEVTGMDIEVSVPQLCIDMGGAILNIPLTRFLKVSDEILLIENLFHMGSREFWGRILFLPELFTLNNMIQKLRE